MIYYLTMNFLKQIFSIQNENTHKVVYIFGLKIKIRNLKKEIKLLKKQINTINYLNDLRIKKILPVNSIKTIELHIVDHCNLNCCGCHHFAPLAPESYLSIAEFKSDLTRLFELTKGDIETFNILGGEPLLHPKCIEFLETARQIFPKSKIRLITNGILLPEQSDDFYKKCGKNNILIQPTDYGLDINWELVKKKCANFGVNFEFYLDNSIMYKDSIDLSGSHNSIDSYLNCQLGWHEYFYLDHGKIYHCSKEAYIRFFNNYFKQNLEIPETDYIDIYKVNNIQEVFNFMNRPPKFCSHCVKTKPPIEYKWQNTKREITEWIE